MRKMTVYFCKTGGKGVYYTDLVRKRHRRSYRNADVAGLECLHSRLQDTSRLEVSNQEELNRLNNMNTIHIQITYKTEIPPGLPHRENASDPAEISPPLSSFFPAQTSHAKSRGSSRVVVK